MQRIRLAGQIGCGLVGVLYILDEPSVGLHPRDNDRLLETLAQLRDQGNTVVVVEHDEDTMRAADYVVDFGPGPGVRGGHVVACGPVEEIVRQPESITGQFLSGVRKIEIPARRRPVGPKKLVIRGATHNNLKDIDVEIPLGVFVCVTGVSGSGKSSLVNDILVEALRRDLNGGLGNPGAHRKIEGLERLDKLIAIDQSPIGRTPRSNPATYIKLFDEIRDLYTQLPESKARGYKPGRFSFNVKSGRCEACEGNGSTHLEMDFLANVWVTCPVCEGHRFNRETLQVRFKGQSIAQVLEMDVQQALEHFENIPKVRQKLQTLHDVGLDYMKLGQPSPTLSGGEAQRVKLARELVKASTGRTLYLLDEPTTGLHFADIQLLLKVLHDFVNAGNTVLVVEHNLEVVKTADWVIDLGPEGGAAGGWQVAAGTPEDVVRVPESHTGRSLRPVLAGILGTPARRNGKATATKSTPRAETAKAIKVRGAWQHNLKGIDVEIPRDQLTVCCGPSGSGKTSLAMDTIYAEGQRRYVESLSAYARQFVGQMPKPRLDHIEGLSPAIAIQQKHSGHTPRSTVGTVTEVYDYLRILMARLGEPYCPDCNVPIGTQSADEVIGKIMDHAEGTRLYLMAPLSIEVGDQYEALWEEIRGQGYARVRIDGQTYSVNNPPKIDRRRKHAVEVVIDRAVIRSDARSRIANSVENALALGKGVLAVAYPQEGVPEPDWQVEVHSQHFACDRCGRSFEPLSPHHFSFNSSLGWCPSCEGLGVQTGANPAALLRDPKLTLAQGAVVLWPDVGSRLFLPMIEALGRGLSVPIDVPFEQLGARHRRLIMHGAGERWFDVPVGRIANPSGDAADQADGLAIRPTGKRKAPARAPVSPGGHAGAVAFRFQYKGLYPALEEASRLSQGLRSRLEHLVNEVECAACCGSRLRDDAAAVRLRGRTIDEICRLPLTKLLEEFQSWEMTSTQRKIAGELVREVRNRVQFLVNVGLEYLTLARPAPTLSGGEAQRIRLAAQVGSGLCGVLYVLDEPTIGLHPRDNRRLLNALMRLRDLGNTLLVVEHDREVVRNADQLLDFGPAAGRLGGQIVARGTPEAVSHCPGSVTGPYLSGEKAIPVPANRRMPSLSSVSRDGRGNGRGKGRATVGNALRGVPEEGNGPSSSPRNATEGVPYSRAPSAGRAKKDGKPAEPLWQDIGTLTASVSPPGGGWLEILGARHNNLKNVDVAIPLGCFSVITGPSGSGKSSLVEDVLYNALSRALHRAKAFAGAHDEIRGLEQINKVIRVNQQALGQTPTSNPATFTGVFDLVRELFAQLPEAKLRGYSPRRFSFNVPGGRCEKCEGNGQLKIEMHFLPDVWVECDACQGRRYEAETLAVRFHGQSIADVLDMACDQALRLFDKIPKIRRILQTLCDVGLGYLTLGQSAAHALRRRGPAGETGRRTLPPRHRADALPLGRAHHGPALRRSGQAAGGAQSPGRSGQHRGGHRAQPGRHQDGRLGDRHGPRSGRRRRLPGRRGHARGRRRPSAEAPPLVHRRRSPAGAGGRAAGPTEALRLRRRGGPPRRRPGDSRGRRRGPSALGDRRPPLAHPGPPRPQRATLPLGRPHPRRAGRSHGRRRAVQPHRLERPQRGGDLRGEEVGRLVLPRHHRRRVAFEAQVSHRPRHLPPRGAGGPAGPQAAERHAQSAGLRPRAAGQSPPRPRAVSGDRAAGPQLRGDRPAGVLEVCRRGDRRLPQIHRPRPGEPRRPHALEGPGPQVAFSAQGLSLRQAAGMGLRGAHAAGKSAGADRA